jgi:photosystem II stability/assembly factor-like uncharacterized protein
MRAEANPGGNMDFQNYRARALRIALMILVASGSPYAATWSETNFGLPGAVPGVEALTVDPTAPSTIYARTNEGIVFKSTDGAVSWRPLSTITGAFFLAVDPKTSATLYASTSRGNVLKSVDGGESWIGASSGLTDSWWATLAIDPFTPSTLYAASFLSGVFRSTDAAGSWKRLNGAPHATSEIVIDPLTSSTIYARAEIGIFKSTDGGETWSAMAAGHAAAALVTALAVDPKDSSTIYLAYRDRGTDPWSVAVTKTADGGKSWNTVESGLPSNTVIRSIAIHPSDPSTISMTFHGNTGGGFVKSVDGGVTWQPINDGLAFGNFHRVLAIHPVDPSTVYAAHSDVRTGTGSVFKSTRGGTDWHRADTGLTDIDIRTLVIDPSNAATVYTGGRDGLFRSLDGGTSWINLITFQLPAPNWPSPLSQPPPVGAGPAHIRSLLIDFANPHDLYARTIRYDGCFASDNLLFKSRDGGATWSDSPSPRGSGCGISDAFHPVLLMMNPTDPNTLYTAAFDDGTSLLKSINGGATWNIVAHWATTWHLNSFVNVLVIDPIKPATLYAGIGDTSESTANGLIKSINGGATWTSSGLGGSNVTALAIDPADPSILYASTEGFNSEPRGFRGLFKSKDRGASWFAINTGLEGLIDTRSRISALVISPANPSVLYAGTAGAGVFRSADGGATWKPFNAGLTNLDVRVLALVSIDPRVLFAGTSGGVFKIIEGAAQE